MRTFELKRDTNETKILLKLELDGKGVYGINSGCGFFNHMLELFTAHSKINLSVECIGDSYVDYHHSVEDIGIALGNAFKNALGDKKGINRYASLMMPMDEALVAVAVDFSGRSYLNYDMQITSCKVGDFDSELVQEFFQAFCRAGEITLHLKQFAGVNSHHLIEACFKGVAKAVRTAIAFDKEYINEIPSTKGVL